MLIGNPNAGMMKAPSVAGWNISTLSYDTKSYDSSEDALPHGLYFKNDGTKMYFAGATNDTIYQYTLSTPWDVSSASYDSKSYGTATEADGIHDVKFNPDGDKMYVSDSIDSTVYQYTLSTPWDVSSASYASKSYAYSGTHTLGRGIFFKPDGATLITVDDSANIYQHTLSTPWDISSASYASKTYASSEETNLMSCSFKPDGTKMYLVGAGNDTVYQYTLGTPWDISTASYASLSGSVGTQATIPRGIFFKPDGTKLYVGNQTDGKIYQYSVGA